MAWHGLTLSYIDGGPCSRPLLGATLAPNLVIWVLKKLFSLVIVKNNICLGGTSKQNAFFENVRPKKDQCPQCQVQALLGRWSLVKT